MISNPTRRFMAKRAAGTVLTFLLLAGSAFSTSTQAVADIPGPPHGLSNAPDSLDALIDRFLAALEKNDAAALNELRVSREEYLDVIVPGTVEKGKAPRQVSEGPKKYFWEDLDFKSRQFSKLIVERFGARHYVEREIEFTEPQREYAWYTAQGELRMRLKDEGDALYQMRVGWVAEVDGKFKFIGFKLDD